MTFKKKSGLELDKDNSISNNATKGNVKELKDLPKTKKPIKKAIITISAVIFTLALITFWAITTIVIPLNRSSGAEKYSGDFRELAEGIYEFESSQKAGDPMPTWLEQYHIEDIHLTTDEERAQYCTDHPERITTDPNRTMAYTIVYSVQNLGFWNKTTHDVVGCQASMLGRAFK